jgi:hypothetical protein
MPKNELMKILTYLDIESKGRVHVHEFQEFCEMFSDGLSFELQIAFIASVIE